MGQQPKNNQIQRMFTVSIIGMSVQLLISIMIPLLIGMAADNHFKTKPLYSLIGILIGVSLSVIVIWNSYKNLTKNTLLDKSLFKDQK